MAGKQKISMLIPEKTRVMTAMAAPSQRKSTKSKSLISDKSTRSPKSPKSPNKSQTLLLAKTAKPPDQMNKAELDALAAGLGCPIPLKRRGKEKKALAVEKSQIINLDTYETIEPEGCKAVVAAQAKLMNSNKSAAGGERKKARKPGRRRKRPRQGSDYDHWVVPKRSERPNWVPVAKRRPRVRYLILAIVIVATYTISAACSLATVAVLKPF